MNEIVDNIRSFNRFYTAIIGVTNHPFLQSRYSFIEARVIYQVLILNQTTARRLKDTLNIDEGYMSRVIAKLVKEGILIKEQSQEDKRVFMLSLSEKGRSVAQEMNERSNNEIYQLIHNLNSEEQTELVNMLSRIKQLLLKPEQKTYAIVHTTEGDLEFSYYLFEEAIAYQKKRGFPVWSGYSKEVLQKEVKQKLQYKIIENGEILCIFSVCYTDPLIWGEKDKNDAIYLHRIVVNPQFKGQKQFEKILNWAKQQAQEKNLKYVRMDTWDDNPNIINYYCQFGFKYLGNTVIPDSEEIGFQYRNLVVALLESPV